MATPQIQTQTDGEETVKEKGIHELMGDLCEFNLGADTTRRRWFVVTKPFGLARKLFKVEPYDPVKGKGEQRSRINSHVRKLKRAMLAGDFTPAPWSGGVREGHIKNLEIDEKKKKVRLKVSERNPLACLDGGHRFESLEDIRKEGDAAMQALVDSVAITVQVYLDPKFIRKDFRNLQAGKQVSRSQLKFMEEEEQVTPLKSVTKKVAWSLNKMDEKDSFLSNDINFVGGGGGKVEYSSITTVGGSDIGTSITGGAKIVLYEGFKTLLPNEDAARDFLIDCYVAAWQGIYKYDEKDTFTDPQDGKQEQFPQLLMPGRMLRPNRLGGRGTKGGTGLIIMLGNMLAFRMLCVRKKSEIIGTEVKRLVDAAREVLDDDVQGGGSGPAKRQATGELAREYFGDVVRQGDGDEHDTKKLDATEGVPLLLTQILSRSTFGLSRKSAAEKEANDPEDREPRQSDPDQTADDWVDSDENEDIQDEQIGQLDTPEEFEPPKPTGKRNKASVGSMG